MCQFHTYYYYFFSDEHHLIFSFRVKFYPADPSYLSLNVRVLLYKQLKRDLNHGRIYCSSNEIVTLGALIVQGTIIQCFLCK